MVKLVQLLSWPETTILFVTCFYVILMAVAVGIDMNLPLRL